jgi:hypothetical protein
MDTFIYKPLECETQSVLDLHYQGTKIVCYECNAELLIIPNWESEAVKKYQRRPGIYCPVNENHVCVWFHLDDKSKELWRRFHERREESAKYKGT